MSLEEHIAEVGLAPDLAAVLRDVDALFHPEIDCQSGYISVRPIDRYIAAYFKKKAVDIAVDPVHSQVIAATHPGTSVMPKKTSTTSYLRVPSNVVDRATLVALIVSALTWRDHGSRAESRIPGLRRRIAATLEPLRSDLLWVMSRAGQELFHSNTLGFHMERHPDATVPLRRLFEGDEPSGPVETWRELHHLDLVGRSASARYVVENKLYSIPYAGQLARYLKKPLPWSTNHGTGGAPDTAYVLLSLMEPAFTLPEPWVVRTYRQVAGALDEIPAAALGEDEGLFLRYRTMVKRLVDLKDAVDPRGYPDEPFSVTALLGDAELGWFLGPLQRMRYSGLLELVRETYRPRGDFGVGLSNASGFAEYLRAIGRERVLGWQMQGDHLRLAVLFKEAALSGKGAAKKLERAAAAESGWLDYFDFDALPETVRAVLVPTGGTQPGLWNHYDPDFVYRYRKVAQTTSSADLARALAKLTERAEQWPERP